MLYVRYREHARNAKHWAVCDYKGGAIWAKPKRVFHTQKEAVTWARATGHPVSVNGKDGHRVHTYQARR